MLRVMLVDWARVELAPSACDVPLITCRALPLSYQPKVMPQDAPDGSRGREVSRSPSGARIAGGSPPRGLHGVTSWLRVRKER